MFKKENLPSVLLILIAICAMLALIFSMHWGPGVGGDATIYITSARNFRAGIGLGLLEPDGGFRLLPYFPPFYPLVLSLLGWLGLDEVNGAYWINILTFGGMVWMIGSSLLAVVRKTWTALAGAALVGFSPILIPVFSWAMSEPLALFLGFVSLVLFLRYLDTLSVKYLVFSAVLAGGSSLTRYSSIAFVGAGLIGILFLTKKLDLKRRFRDLMVYGLISMLPLLTWLFVDINLTSTVASRSMESGMGARVATLFPLLWEVFRLWLLPESLLYNPPYPQTLNLVIFGAAILALIFFGWAVIRSLKSSSGINNECCKRLAFLLISFIVIYLLVITAVYITTYPPITIGSRMLSPVHLAFLWMISLGAVILVDALEGKVRVRRLMIGVFILAAAWYGVRSARIVAQNYDEGLGYLSRSWQQSDTIQAVREISDETILVSNETNALLFLTGRLAYPLKEIYWDEPLQDFTAYGQGNYQQDEGQRVFREEGAALVLFDTIDDQLIELYGDQTGARIDALVRGLYRAYRGSDGGIFYYQEP